MPWGQSTRREGYEPQFRPRWCGLEWTEGPALERSLDHPEDRAAARLLARRPPEHPDRRDRGQQAGGSGQHDPLIGQKKDGISAVPQPQLFGLGGRQIHSDRPFHLPRKFLIVSFFKSFFEFVHGECMSLSSMFFNSICRCYTCDFSTRF